MSSHCDTLAYYYGYPCFSLSVRQQVVRKSTTKQPRVEVAEVDPSTTKNRINAIKIGATLFT